MTESASITGSSRPRARGLPPGEGVPHQKRSCRAAYDSWVPENEAGIIQSRMNKDTRSRMLRDDFDFIPADNEVGG
jgi:hypothetical protein